VQNQAGLIDVAPANVDVELFGPPPRLQREVNPLGLPQYGRGDDRADRAGWHFRHIHVGDRPASRHLVTSLIPSHNFLMKPTGLTFSKMSHSRSSYRVMFRRKSFTRELESEGRQLRSKAQAFHYTYGDREYALVCRARLYSTATHLFLGSPSDCALCGLESGNRLTITIITARAHCDL
jgi:hypothetical protein